MKNVKLKTTGFADLTDAEMRNANGGGWAITIPLILSAIHNWKDIREGFQDGYNGQSRY